MMRLRLPVLAAPALLILCAWAPSVWAGSATATLPITIQKPLQITFNPSAPTIACNTPAGTKVADISATGGDGNAVTYSTTSGDTTDFAISGTQVVVGANGIATANCGQVNNLGVTGTQP